MTRTCIRIYEARQTKRPSSGPNNPNLWMKGRLWTTEVPKHKSVGGTCDGHTPLMTIDGDVVRRLVDADDDAVLVLLEGRAQVIGAGELDDDAHRGALQVISRSEFLQRVGNAADFTDDEVAAQAAILDAEVSELGG